MNLIQEIRKDGKRGRACGGKCYNAKGDKCTCLCGGLNHGKGDKKAIENVREICRKGEHKEGYLYHVLFYQGVLKLPKAS